MSLPTVPYYAGLVPLSQDVPAAKTKTDVHLVLASFTRLPNRQRTLNKLRTELRCTNFVDEHRLSIQIGAKRAEKRVCNVYVFQLSFHFAYHRWWLGTISSRSVFTGTSCAVLHTPHTFWAGGGTARVVHPARIDTQLYYSET